MSKTVYVYKNKWKKKPEHPDYRIIIKDGEEVILESGAYIATDRQTGEMRRDKFGNTYIYGKLTEPKKKDSPQPTQQNTTSDEGFIY